MGIVHKISVDIVRGFEQKDPRWAAWASEYAQSQDIFAFWNTTTVESPTKEDLRTFARQNRANDTAGQRPGGSPSQEIAPFTTQDQDQPDFVTMDPDRVAVLKVIRRVKKTSSKTVTDLKVIGERREKKDKVIESLDSILSLDGVEVLFETDSFMLQSGQETFQEKFEIKETFGEPVLFTFGERQKVFQYGGVLYDTESWQWKEKFLHNYERHLRGSKAIENEAIVLLITNSAIIRGYLLSCSILQNDQTHGYVGFSFSMFAQDRIPLNEIEPSPQDRKQAQEDESIPTIFYTITDKVSKSTGEALKTLDRTAATVELPNGFQAGAFHQDDSTPPTHFVAGGLATGDDVVNGLAATPLKFTLSPAGQPSYTPPDLPLIDPMPAVYKNEIILGTLSIIQSTRDTDLEAPVGGGNPATFSFRFMEALIAGTGVPSAQTMVYAGGVSGASFFSRDQVDKLQALAKTGNLSVKIAKVGDSTSLAPLRKVKIVNRLGDGNAFQSIDVSKPLRTDGTGLSFEIQLRDAASFATPIQPGDNYRIEVYEDNKVVPLVPTGFFHAYDSQKLKYVGSDSGASRATESLDKHVLTDPTATFLDDIEPNLDAGDLVFVTLPYGVVDEGNKDANGKTVPDVTAKVKVYKVLSQTSLQLGLLRKLPVNKKDVERQRIGRIDLTSYKVIVERANTIKLVEAKIKSRVKDPADGAFNNTNMAVADLVQPQGVFKMQEGTHFTT